MSFPRLVPNQPGCLCTLHSGDQIHGYTWLCVLWRGGRVWIGRHDTPHLCPPSLGCLHSNLAANPQLWLEARTGTPLLTWPTS